MGDDVRYVVSALVGGLILAAAFCSWMVGRRDLSASLVFAFGFVALWQWDR